MCEDVYDTWYRYGMQVKRWDMGPCTLRRRFTL